MALVQMEAHTNVLNQKDWDFKPTWAVFLMNRPRLVFLQCADLLSTSVGAVLVSLYLDLHCSTPFLQCPLYH